MGRGDACFRINDYAHSEEGFRRARELDSTLSLGERFEEIEEGLRQQQLEKIRENLMPTAEKLEPLFTVDMITLGSLKLNPRRRYTLIVRMHSRI